MKRLLILLLVCFVSMEISAAPALSARDKEIGDQQLIYQQERQKALEASLSAEASDVRLLPPLERTQLIVFPEEHHCFPIDKVELLERQTLPLIVPLYSLSTQAEGRCLGAEGINILMSELQNRLISYGFITTRIVVPPQDLTSRTLSLLFVKGVVRDIYYSQDSDTHANLNVSMPIKKGEILNLRDIEQGLENLQRLPTTSAQMQLIPGDLPGESDIVIHRRQSKYWRLGFSLDDSGTKDTGRYQGGITFYLDNPLALNDSFYVSGGHDLNRNSKYGSKNYLFSYSVPFGYWLFSASVSGNTYYQNVAGAIADYEYSGRSKNTNFQLSRVIHRNESQKTTLSYGITLRESRNYINDTQIDLQHRKTTSWRLGIQHRHYIDDIILDASASYRKGVRWFGAQKAPEEYLGDGTALFEIFNLNASLSVPFTLSNQHFRYTFDYYGQMTRQGNLTPQERFSIGSRWSVRGFDGELTLSADNGWYVRNELSWQVPRQQELYLGLDIGEVSGADSGYLLGKRLAGSVIGLRGNQFGIYYDLFAGTPLYKPDGFKTDDISMGFYLNWTF